jgi:hypothetical protein
MRRLGFALATLIALAIYPGRETTGQDKPDATFEQDRNKLEGVWSTDEWGKKGAKGWQSRAEVSLKGLKSPQLTFSIRFESADPKGGVRYVTPPEPRSRKKMASVGSRLIPNWSRAEAPTRRFITGSIASR